MDPDSRIIEALSDPKFKTYFLDLLPGDISDDEKYQRVLDYFRAPRSGQDWLFEARAPQKRRVGDEGENHLPAGWDVDAILTQTANSIRRAVRRLKRSQHPDGGWGPLPGQSTFWHTASTVLCLLAARRSDELTLEACLDELLQSGYAYLEQHPEHWASDLIEPEGALSVYDLCLMSRCFLLGGREFVRRETAVRIYRGIERLYHAQNEDGGWDASLWGYAVTSPVRRFSEVGATSAAMQVLAAVGDDRFVTSMQRAGQWLACAQNTSGSWNNGSTRPDLEAFTLTGDPRTSKTCDALQGILAMRVFGLPGEPYHALVGRAVEWVRRSEMPVLEKGSRVSGWGWGYSAADYENIGLLLETLLAFPNPPLGLLSACAAWLVTSQRRQEGDSEDGAWVLGPTARITGALIEYYHKVQAVARSMETYRSWLP